MRSLNIIDWIAILLLIVGGLNWGLMGILELNLISKFFGEMSNITRIIYILVGLSSL
ncbi:MAG TPA: DUF378 domain-containing protein, partial [Coxiellaceae bacterium]|nr:DUF378 domain-containing protein [Coxiellaceae bacterium]